MHFPFNGKFYNQFDRLVMGSPLTSVVANTFISFYESEWLNEYNLNKSKLYLRYVDDIIAAFEKEKDSLNFLNFLKNKHPNIKIKIKNKLTIPPLFYCSQNLTLQTNRKSTYTELNVQD